MHYIIIYRDMDMWSQQQQKMTINIIIKRLRGQETFSIN